MMRIYYSTTLRAVLFTVYTTDTSDCLSTEPEIGTFINTSFGNQSSVKNSRLVVVWLLSGMYTLSFVNTG